MIAGMREMWYADTTPLVKQEQQAKWRDSYEKYQTRQRAIGHGRFRLRHRGHFRHFLDD